MALPIGQIEQFVGQTRITAAEAVEHETDLKAKRFTEIPSNMQMRAQYSSTDGQPDYVGYAPRGLTSATTGWLLHKYTYDGSRQCTLRQIAYDSWNNVATATYA